MSALKFRVARQCKTSSVLPLPGLKKEMFSEIVEAFIITKRYFPLQVLQYVIIGFTF